MTVEKPKIKTQKPRGILHPHQAQKNFLLQRFFPSVNIQVFVEHYWIVQWDLQGKPPYLQENLPFPCVHFVVESGNSHVVGVMTNKFSRWLEGKGKVFGVKFRPGGFYPFVRFSVSQLTDRAIGVQEAFGVTSSEIENELLVLTNEKMVSWMDRFLQQRSSQPDDKIAIVAEIVNYIENNRHILQVDDLTSEFGMGKRTLQRLFDRYVGIGPKWVIRRFRLHELAEKIAQGQTDWQQLLYELGYVDQSHFIKDFKQTVGCTPVEYAKRVIDKQ